MTEGGHLRRLRALLGGVLLALATSCGSGIGTEAESPDGETHLLVKPVPATEAEPFDHPATVSATLVRELITRETPRLRFAAEAVALELAKAGPQQVIGLCEQREEKCFVDLKLYVRGGELYYVGRDIGGGSRSIGAALPLSGSARPAARTSAKSGCTVDQECEGGQLCLSGACVEDTPGCRSNVDCKGTRVCHLGKCVSSEPAASAATPPPPAPPAGGGCSSDAHCKGTRVCRGGHCVEP